MERNARRKESAGLPKYRVDSWRHDTRVTDKDHIGAPGKDFFSFHTEVSGAQGGSLMLEPAGEEKCGAVARPPRPDRFLQPVRGEFPVTG